MPPTVTDNVQVLPEHGMSVVIKFTNGTTRRELAVVALNSYVKHHKSSSPSCHLGEFEIGDEYAEYGDALLTSHD